MKKIIFILALFVSFVANSQYTPPTGYTNINSRYDWLAGVFRALGLPAGGNAAFTTGQAQRAGSVYYDSTGVDAGLYVWSGSAWVGVQYTDADARSAISLTTTGTSGAATYSSATGVFNIPNYQGGLSEIIAGYGLLNVNDSTLDVDSLVIANRDWVMDRIDDIDEPNLLLDSLGATGISPITTWNNTIYGRRISISGGSIDTTASGGLLITVTGAGANTALSNLASVAINTSLISDADNTDDLGSSALAWKDAYAYTFKLKNASGGITTLSPTASASNFTITLPAATGTVALLNGANTWTAANTFTNTLSAQGTFTTGSTALLSDVSILGTGSSGSITQSEFLPNGIASIRYRVGMRGSTAAAPAPNESVTGLLIGRQTITETTTGNHDLFSSAWILPPTITGAAATVSNTATLYIDAAASATVSGGNYAIWSNDGANRFDGLFNANGTNLTANQIWGANSGATAMEGKTLTNGQNIKITHGAGTATFAGATLTKAPTVENPGAAENIWSWKVPVAITITDVHAVLVGSGSPSVTYNIKFDTDRSAAGTSVYTSNQTVTSTTTGTSASGVNDATIPAGSIVWIITSAQSGTVNQLGLTITYTED